MKPIPQSPPPCCGNSRRRSVSSWARPRITIQTDTNAVRQKTPLVTPQRGRYPHTDDGVEVRRRFHQLRSRAIENFNEPCKGIVDAHGPVPTKGLINTRRFALGAIVVDPLAWPHRIEQSQDLRVGLNPFLKAA